MDRQHMRNRHTMRIKDFDYSQPGGYFVTICTKHRLYLFGEIFREEMRLSSVCEIAKRFWLEIPKYFPNTELDEFVIMPNHIHAIIIINSSVVGIHHNESLRKHSYQHIIPYSLGSIIRSYKGAVYRECRRQGYDDFYWQRNYYEHIIRNDKDLNNIRDYIEGNISKWEIDKDNHSISDFRTIPGLSQLRRDG